MKNLEKELKYLKQVLEEYEFTFQEILQLLEWSQKKKLLVRYETIAEPQPNKSTVFRSLVWLGEEKIANATETSKKKAEEKAAQRAFYALNKKENILAATKVNS